MKHTVIKNVGANCTFQSSTIDNVVIDVSSHTDFQYLDNIEKGLNGFGTPNNAEIFLAGDAILFAKNNIGIGRYYGGTSHYFDNIGNGCTIDGNTLLGNLELDFESHSAVTFEANGITNDGSVDITVVADGCYVGDNLFKGYVDIQGINTSSFYENEFAVSSFLESIDHDVTDCDFGIGAHVNLSVGSLTHVSVCNSSVWTPERDYSNVSYCSDSTYNTTTAAPTGETYMLTTDDKGKYGSQAIPGSFIPITKSALSALYSNYQVGATYRITDAANTYCPTSQIYITAITDSLLDFANCTRTMNVPFTYASGTSDGNGGTMQGIWNSTAASYSVDDLVIWGARVWINFTGNTGAATDDITLNGSDWNLRDQPTYPYDYIDMTFGCSYDLANDWVSRQWDNKGVSVGWDITVDAQLYGFGFNPCDVTDWNYETNGFAFNNVTTGGVWNNVCGNIIFNNVRQYISDNNVPFDISSNFCDIISGQTFTNSGITQLYGQYLELKVLLTQSSTSAPSATVLFDNLSASVGGITFGRSGAGSYTATRGDANAWDATKTEVIIGSANNGSIIPANSQAFTQPADPNIIISTQLFTLGSFVGTDGELNRTSFTIRVYF